MAWQTPCGTHHRPSGKDALVNYVVMDGLVTRFTPIHPYIIQTNNQSINMNWIKLSSEYISKHPYFTARKDVCQMPGGKIVEAYYVVELPASVCALAITEAGNVIMERQYRHPLEETILELPGGFVDPGEVPMVAIERELLEETGHVFSSIEYVGKVAANPGVLSGYTYLYLARGGKKVATQSLDANEEIELLQIPLEAVRAMLSKNEIVQALHVSCLMYGFQKLDADIV
jgi:8-oxo-dGTP pyrophosphatase MutT (NUDIX family)